MKFQNKTDYETQRTTLMNEVKSLMDAGKLTEAEAKMSEVEKLDNDWADDAKEVANKAALESKLTSLGAKVLSNGGEVIEMANKVFMDPNPTNSNEYRNGFMNYVLSGDKTGLKLNNANAFTTTSDVGVVIPTTVMQKIVEKIEKAGNILSLVNRTNFKGGVAVPISNLKPVATWVAERGTSDKQKKTLGSITFAYRKLRCAIVMSLEVATVTLDIFEEKFVQQVSEAMIKALDEAIIKGAGAASNQPDGIITATIVAGQNVDITKAKTFCYDTVIAAESALPEEYENSAIWCMRKQTFMKLLEEKDSTGKPLAVQTYLGNGKIERTIIGRRVETTQHMPAYVQDATANAVVAFLFNFEDYTLNTNLDITVKRYEDNDTEDEITKAIGLFDGKVVDNNSLVTVTKKNA